MEIKTHIHALNDMLGFEWRYLADLQTPTFSKEQAVGIEIIDAGELNQDTKTLSTHHGQGKWSVIQSLAIPETIEGLPVLAIAAHAFEQAQFSGSITANSVAIFGEACFKYAHFTGDLMLPHAQIIKEHAFYESVFDGRFDCPNVTHIQKEAFLAAAFTGDLALIYCQEIGSHAFAKNNRAKSLQIRAF